MTIKRLHLTAATVLLGGSLSLGAAFAQTPPPRPASDDPSAVIVTATRRAEKAQDVAMQISAYSAQTLAAAGVKTGKDIVRLTPGMSFTAPTGDAGAVVFNMRGVGLNDFGVGNESPVAIYADDVYVASLSAAAAPTFDLDRVEVLRGPQGTLFGRNATGGLVHFVSARPKSEFDGYADARVGDGYAIEGAVNVPVSKSIATRLSLTSERVDPWIKNALGEGGNGVERTAGRFQVLLDRPNYSALLNLHGGVTRSHPQFTFLSTAPGADGLGVASKTPANDVFGVPATPAFRALLDNDPFTGAVNTQGKNDRKAYGATLRLDWKLGDVDVTAISNGERGETDYLEDSDMSPVRAFEIPSFSRAIQYSQELRAARTGEKASWVAGVYYFHNHVINPRRFDLYAAGVSYDSKMDQTAKSAAIFGELTYKLTDTITAVGGLRYTSETRDTDFRQVLRGDVDGSGFPSATNTITPIFAFGHSTVGSRAERTDDNFSGRVRLEWRPTTGLLWYAAWNRGFKSGGFNNPLTADNFTPALMPYEPETLDSGEIGVKSDLFANRLRINANAFSYDYKKFQSFKTDGLSNFLANVDARISGINVDFLARPTDRLTLTGGIEALDAKASNITLPSLRRAERKLANAPEFSAVASLKYEQPIGSGSASAEISARYVGEQYYDISNAPVTKEQPYTVTDARVSYRLGASGPEFYVAGTNIFDETYRLYVIDVNALGFSQAMYGRPRSVAAGVRFDF